MRFPAYELTRVEFRDKPRTDWPARWQAAGESVHWQGALKDRMIAEPDSPIWAALGNGVGGFHDATGFPFPPFAFGSGLGWVVVDFPQDLAEVPSFAACGEVKNLNSTTQHSTLITQHSEQAMNEAKTRLLLLVATTLSEESCSRILARLGNSVTPSGDPATAPGGLFVANARWNPDLHPRDDYGRFTYVKERASKIYAEEKEPQPAKDGSGMTAIGYTKRDIKRRFGDYNRASIESYNPVTKEVRPLSTEQRKEMYEALEDLNNLVAKLDALEEIERQEKMRGTPKTRPYANLDDADLDDRLDELEEMYGDREKGVGMKWPETEDADHARVEYRQLCKERDIRKKKEAEYHQKNLEAARAYREADERIDELEEMYGDREKGVGMKWPETEDADHAREEYKKLRSKLKILQKKIDWKDIDPKELDEEPEVIKVANARFNATQHPRDDHGRFAQVLGDATKHYLTTSHALPKQKLDTKAYEEAVRKLGAMIHLKPVLDPSRIEDPTKRKEMQDHLEDLARQVKECDEILKKSKFVKVVK